MTGPHPDTRDTQTRPISVAELLARNGTIGSPPVTGRRRRRRGNSDAVTVAELTGEIPVITDDDSEPDRDSPASDARPAPDTGPTAEAVPEQVPEQVLEQVTDQPADSEAEADRSGPEPRWPKSMPQSPPSSGPEHSHYPRPVRRSESVGAGNGQGVRRPGRDSDAEQMSPDTIDNRAVFGVDVMAPVGTEDRDDEPVQIEVDDRTEPAGERSRWSELWSGGLIVLQSILAVVFGAGLFIAFDQLWRWNNIVALVLTVLVTLGLVAAVQAVRRTVDVGSTLIAVAVGLLITLGPLALHAN